MGDSQKGESVGANGGSAGGKFVDPFQAQLNSLLTDYPTQDTEILDAENGEEEGGGGSEELEEDYDDFRGSMDDSSDEDVEREGLTAINAGPWTSPYGGIPPEAKDEDGYDETKHEPTQERPPPVDTIDPATFFRNPKNVLESKTKAPVHRGSITKRSFSTYSDDDDDYASGSSFSGKVGR